MKQIVLMISGCLLGSLAFGQHAGTKISPQTGQSHGVVVSGGISQNAIVRGAAERNAVNAPIQGSAADIIKLAMINIYNRFEKEGFKSKMLLQVHDELVFDAHKDELEIIKPIIKEEMENAFKMAVPLDVEIGEGENWLQAH